MDRERINEMLRKFLKDTEGAALIEFAFILPVFVILVAGGMQLSWALFVNHSLLDAVQSTTRSVSVGEIDVTDNAAILAAVKARMNINIAGVAIQTAISEDEDVVSITGTIPRANVAMVDILGLFGTGYLSSKTTMRLE